MHLAPRGMSIGEADRWVANATIDRIRRKIREMDVWVAEVNDRIVGWVAVRGDFLEGLYTDPGAAGCRHARTHVGGRAGPT